MVMVTNFDTNHSVFFQCNCKQEILVIDYDHECKIADLAIYESQSSFYHKLSLWQRLRYSFQTIFTGKPYHDQIILDSIQLEQLKNFLFSIET